MDKDLFKKIKEGTLVAIIALTVYITVAYVLELVRVLINKMPMSDIDITWLSFPILFFTVYSTWAWFDAKEDNEDE